MTKKKKRNLTHIVLLAALALVLISVAVYFGAKLIDKITGQSYRSRFAAELTQADRNRDALIVVLDDNLILKEHASDCEHSGPLGGPLQCQGVSYAVFGTNLDGNALAQNLLGKLQAAGYSAQALGGPNINTISRNGQNLGSINWDGMMEVATSYQTGFGPAYKYYGIDIPAKDEHYRTYYILTVGTPNLPNN